ncbi:transporter substrate-binding domain-containing protein [Legionella waltersii]|uniref:Arginine-binding periplasmic protein n=1 Tax=Legionella waltersii TaxID=66969 RepID=A0A0W1A510_9GAMM|nr:transporter substrate-binding domain-containing protein [Legionella waltersii]KTD76455.1 arginine-binding periplasmic protein [Legionella waltersii]SNV14549.1 arginine-binding periplasmic protein [Legionella waltersii]
MTKIRSGIIRLVFLLLIVSPCYAVINVGTVEFDPPYVISLNQGFEIELVKSICHQLNQECIFKRMDYNKLFSALDSGSIDLAMDNIDFYVSPNALNGDYLYSFPYLLSKGQFLVLKSSGIKSVHDLPAGSKIGLVREQAQQNQGIFYNFFLNKYKSQFKVVIFDDLDSLLTNLTSGNIDAAFLDRGEVNYWVLDESKQFKALGNPMKVADGIGLMSLPSNASLMAQVNQALEQLEQSGEYSALYTTYFGISNY